MVNILANYHDAFLGGLAVTLELLVLIAFVGIPLGVVVGVIGARMSRPIGSFVSGIYFITGAIPVLVLLFWMHYPLQSIFRVVIDPFWTTVIALGFVNFVLTAELVRRELNLLPKAYREAARTLGLAPVKIARFVELPILARRAIPQLLANQGKMLEYTLFASFISVPELFRVAQNVNAVVYRPVEVYSLLVLFFLIILIPLHLVVRHLEKKYAS
jgi:His/Glu/Gln/Arg/opine family amino acid ABC transporter permease subunit